MPAKTTLKFNFDLEKIRKIADYQCGKGVGKHLFSDNVAITYSKRTKRIRHIYLGKDLLATLRPRDGLFSLTVAGAQQITKHHNPPPCYAKVNSDAEPFVKKGKTLFAKHVVEADKQIRPKEEVIVLNQNGNVIAVGKAVLTGEEMTKFKSGVAVKIRKGIEQETHKITIRSHKKSCEE